MRAIELLAEFVDELGYKVCRVDAPRTTPMHPSVDEFGTYRLLILGCVRDGKLPVRRNSLLKDSWCTVTCRTIEGGRFLCEFSVDARSMDLPVVPYVETRIMFLDDPGALPRITAFLDHWYFRIFQCD